MAKQPTQHKRPGPNDDPVTFWAQAWRESVDDAEAASEIAPSVLPAHRKLIREAWREWQAAKASAAARVKPKKNKGPDLSLEGQLEVARRMRVAAEAGGSFVAAAKLLQEEASLIESIRQRDEAEEKRRRAERSPEDLRQALVVKIKAMPDAMRARIRAELGW